MNEMNHSFIHSFEMRCDAMRDVSAHADARVGSPRAMSNAVKKGIDKVRLMYARDDDEGDETTTRRRDGDGTGEGDD